MAELEQSGHGSPARYFDYLNWIIGDMRKRKLLDLCCGEMPFTRDIHCASSLHVDIHDWPTRPQGFNFSQGDVLVELLSLPSGSFDVALLSDGLEHLEKGNGQVVIGEMRRVAVLPVVWAPIGPCALPYVEERDRHKSAWTPAEFVALGWDTMAYPEWHPELGLGAFFAWTGRNAA